MSLSSQCSLKKRSFMLLLSVLLADILIVNSFFSNTASVSRLQSCSSPNLRVESECLTAHSMVPLGGLDVEVTSFPVPIEKWFPTGDDLSIPAPLNQLVDVNLERRSVVYEVTLGRVIGIEIIQGPVGPVVGQVMTTLQYHNIDQLMCSAILQYSVESIMTCIIQLGITRPSTQYYVCFSSFTSVCVIVVYSTDVLLQSLRVV